MSATYLSFGEPIKYRLTWAKCPSCSVNCFDEDGIRRTGFECSNCGKDIEIHVDILIHNLNTNLPREDNEQYKKKFAENVELIKKSGTKIYSVWDENQEQICDNEHYYRHHQCLFVLIFQKEY